MSDSKVMTAIDRLHKLIDDPKSWHFLQDMIASVPLAQKDPRYAIAAGVANMLLQAMEEHKQKDLDKANSIIVPEESKEK
jgi:hypothetical protein